MKSFIQKKKRVKKIQKNKECKKVKGSRLLLVSCGHCKEDLAVYQKQGRGNLLNMYLERIVEASFDFDRLLICPKCQEELGFKIQSKISGKEAYKMKRSTFNTKEL